MIKGYGKVSLTCLATLNAKAVSKSNVQNNTPLKRCTEF